MRIDVALFSILACASTACGARSDLWRPEVDASSDVSSPVDVMDATPHPFMPPDCGNPIPPGAIRYSIDHVVGRGAADASGNVYVPVEPARGARAVRSVDACGRLRWQSEPIAGPLRGGLVRITSRGEVLLTDVHGERGVVPVQRYEPISGRSLGAIETASAAARVIAVPAGEGPLIATVDASRLVSQLDRFDAEGVHLETLGDWSNANECSVANGRIACRERAWDLGAHRLLWTHSLEILDGTLRHVVGVAPVGDRVYTFFFGISTYAIDAYDVRTGVQMFRRTVATSTTGQSNMLAAGPVVRDDGEVFVYLQVGGFSGRVVEFTPAGERVRTFEQSATTEVFDLAGSLALGTLGKVFLAVGRAVYGLDRNLTVEWRTGVMERVDRAWTMLTPAGDLLVHTENDRMLAFVSGSAGVPAGGWPIDSGDERNAVAR